jgi:hypothetical protein
MTKQVQVGWEFKSSNIYTKDYTKVHYFPADCSTSRYFRGGDVDGEHIEEVSGVTYETDNGRFEILIEETVHGKTTYKKVFAVPRYEEQEVEE